MFAQLIASSTVLSSGVNLAADGSAERLRAELVSGNYFSVLGVGAALGRVLSDDDDRGLAAHPLVVLSHAAWQRSFGRQPDVVGRTIQLNAHPYTIIGVMPEGFFGTRVGFTPDLWAPLSMTEQMSGGTTPSSQGNFIELALRLSSAQLVAGREAALTSAFRRWTAPTAPASGDAPLPALRLLPSSRGLSLLRAQYGQPLVILLAAVGVLLLIACANVGTLLLARGIARRREMAIRLSMGGTPYRIVRQVFTECLLLALAGGASGLVRVHCAWPDAPVVSPGQRVGLAVFTQPPGIPLHRGRGRARQHPVRPDSQQARHPTRHLPVTRTKHSRSAGTHPTCRRTECAQHHPGRALARAGRRVAAVCQVAAQSAIGRDRLSAQQRAARRTGSGQERLHGRTDTDVLRRAAPGAR